MKDWMVAQLFSIGTAIGIASAHYDAAAYMALNAVYFTIRAAMLSCPDSLGSREPSDPAAALGDSSTASNSCDQKAQEDQK